MYQWTQSRPSAHLKPWLSSFTDHPKHTTIFVMQDRGRYCSVSRYLGPLHDLDVICKRSGEQFCNRCPQLFAHYFLSCPLSCPDTQTEKCIGFTFHMASRDLNVCLHDS